jgi:hypothetical protein
MDPMHLKRRKTCPKSRQASTSGSAGAQESVIPTDVVAGRTATSALKTASATHCCAAIDIRKR